MRSRAGPDNAAPGTVRRILDGLYLVSGYLAGMFLIAIFLMMLALSVGRELGINVKSGDDIASWCMAAMAFLGLAHTFKSGEMIRVGLLTERLTGRTKWITELFALLMAALFIGFFAWHAVDLILTSWRINDMSTGVLVVPLWIPAARLHRPGSSSSSSPLSTSWSTSRAATSRATRRSRRRPPKRSSSAPSRAASEGLAPWTCSASRS